MQKYLLLLLMCLVGMIETQAGIKVDNVGSGSYVLTFTNGTTESDWSKLSDIKSATSVKIVTDGYKLSTNDMMKLTGAYDGDKITFFATVRNIGNKNAEGNISVAFYINGKKYSCGNICNSFLGRALLCNSWKCA